MRFKALTVAVTAVGALALAASPASAANWQTVSTNSNWVCSEYKHHQVSNFVNYKVCIVVNANDDAQVVLVVQNAADVAVSIAGTATGFGSNVNCPTSTLNPGFTRGCYSPTIQVGSEVFIKGNVRLTLNGVAEWYSEQGLIVYHGKSS